MKPSSHSLSALYLTLALFAACASSPHDRERLEQTADPGLLDLDGPLRASPEPNVEPRPVLEPGPIGEALFVTSALKGYVEPCGCTIEVVLGGIDRVSGYVRTLLERTSFAAVVIDTGNLLFEGAEIPESERTQAKMKAELLLQAQRAMGTVSTTPGPFDFALGVEVYRELVAGAELPITVVNLALPDGSPLGAGRRQVMLGQKEVALFGVVEPALFEGIDGLVVEDPEMTLRRALDSEPGSGVEVLVVQGSRAFAVQMAETFPELDFVLLGTAPELNDEVQTVGTTHLLEVYDQGRAVGVLKLYPDSGGSFTNARGATREELERLDRRIEYLDDALDHIPPSSGEAPPFVVAKREELGSLKEERAARSLEAVDLTLPGDRFAWFVVTMEPGYPLDTAITQRKDAYLAALEALYEELAPSAPAAVEGQPTFASQAACSTCHTEAHALWSSSRHAGAYASLVERSRQHDPDCLKCHVTGYAQPGGSIVGALGAFENVQCEACHGPASLHISSGGDPSSLTTEVLCEKCHDPINSPRFDRASYLPLILGPGHGGRAGSGLAIG